MLGTTAIADRGDVGYEDESHRTLTADQQSLRLMLEQTGNNDEWTFHAKAYRQHLDGYSAVQAQPSDLFRYDAPYQDWWSESGTNSSSRISAEIDRASYKHRFTHTSLTLGRQPIDWGSGRFWQPLNVFGAFSPTDLDTDFKPGIDAATLDWYPSAFSSLTAAYVLAPQDNSELENSAAVHYRSQAGNLSEYSLLVASVLGNRVYGGSFESAWQGMGWRVEGVRYHIEDTGEDSAFWIAGVDYQFSDGTLVAAEWYDNTRGATTESALSTAGSDRLVHYGLQQQLGRQVLGLTAERDLTPLLHGGYTLLATGVEDEQGNRRYSLLNQLNLRYSVGNESDLLLSLLGATGKGLDAAQRPQSEFGYLPVSMTLRLRFYF